MTDFYSQNRCVCSTRSHGPLLCTFCLSFHFNAPRHKNIAILITFANNTHFITKIDSVLIDAITANE